jgi:hypothetical protein
MIKQAIKGLWTSFLQWGINLISDRVFWFKKREAIKLCRQYRAKYYVIQQGYFTWQVLRAQDIDIYKRKGFIARGVTAKTLHEASAFVAVYGVNVFPKL